MRFLFVLLLACVVITGMVTAEGVATSYTLSAYERLGESCTNDAYPGLADGTGIAVVEVSGHTDTTIDGKPVEPVATGMYNNYPVRVYATTEGSHTVVMAGGGYFTFTSIKRVCAGKVSYLYYDMDAHIRSGTTKAVTTTTAIPATPNVTATTTIDGQSGDYSSLKDALGTKAAAETLGSLSISTDPEGALVYIDGVHVGISPAVIPGIPEGTHTLVLRREGYQDLTLPVVISAGKTHSYSSALAQNGMAPAITPAMPTTKKSSAPGFGAIFAACVAGALLLVRKTRS